MSLPDPSNFPYVWKSFPLGFVPVLFSFRLLSFNGVIARQIFPGPRVHQHTLFSRNAGTRMVVNLNCFRFGSCLNNFVGVVLLQLKNGIIVGRKVIVFFKSTSSRLSLPLGFCNFLFCVVLGWYDIDPKEAHVPGSPLLLGFDYQTGSIPTNIFWIILCPSGISCTWQRHSRGS